MSSYKELLSQIEVLKQQAESQRKSEIAAVVADIRAKMQEYGITVSDLGGPTGRGSRSKGMTVAAKYRHPRTGETWTGRGKMPKWLQAEVQTGKRKEDFLIV
ncbi:MAG: H-NS histone family protein [Gammaproteobacteria bacterium]|nr:H-NS histone family protein [Gammaproteobacteria bacterium]